MLLNVAFGDHQVTNWAADVEARTIGASTHRPILDPGRWPGVDQLFGIPRIGSYPFSGSAIVYWDIGPVRPDPDNPGRRSVCPRRRWRTCRTGGARTRTAHLAEHPTR